MQWTRNVSPAPGPRKPHEGHDGGYVERVSIGLPALVLADRPTLRARRLATALGADIAALDAASGAHQRVIIAFSPPENWGSLRWDLLALTPRALVVVPLGPPAPLPRWSGPIARFLFPSQAAAREWLPHIPLGRLVVVEPGPEPQPAPGGVFVAGPEGRLDPEGVIAAAASGAAIVSLSTHGCLPPGAVITSDPEGERAALLADEPRRQRLGQLAHDWWLRGRTSADEAVAFRAVVAEVLSPSRRGGRG